MSILWSRNFIIQWLGGLTRILAFYLTIPSSKLRTSTTLSKTLIRESGSCLKVPTHRRTNNCWWRSWHISVMLSRSRTELLKPLSQWSRPFSFWRNINFQWTPSILLNLRTLRLNWLMLVWMLSVRSRRRFCQCKLKRQAILKHDSLNSRSELVSSDSISKTTIHTTSRISVRRLFKMHIKQSLITMLKQLRLKRKLKSWIILRYFSTFKNQLTSSWKTAEMSWWIWSTCGIWLLWWSTSSITGSRHFGTRLILSSWCNWLKTCRLNSATQLLSRTRISKTIVLSLHWTTESRTWTPFYLWLLHSTPSSWWTVTGRNSWKSPNRTLLLNLQNSALKILSNCICTSMLKRLQNLLMELKRRQKSSRSLEWSKKLGSLKISSSRSTKKCQS